MIVRFVVVLTLVFLPCFFMTDVAAQSDELVGDAATGQRAFMGTSGGAFCGLCHGFGGRGGFGPDLGGGRGLTFSQFKRAVREPWGVMPTFPRVTDQTLANIYAYLLTTDKVEEPAPWRIALPPADAPSGQHAATAHGCTQCHSGELLHPRRDLGKVAADVDFDHFKQVIYEHAPVQMGQWSRERLPELLLREIYDFIMLEGLLVPFDCPHRSRRAGRQQCDIHVGDRKHRYIRQRAGRGGRDDLSCSTGRQPGDRRNG